ncbi:YhcN/YlaJ family sporulation lipoprotein [Tumebacillus sp. ITR2]|uniref:YhcN/YlaJ family sporulation lipoprotein n=1 Tax=Tumebacillus amylolyticus TaxID=2801339 RepID=A0ABS1J7D1_9BACL|nr:YhcN/YlaJ family sporulation lipoprotein [Tumebacillus amylolyticus]MBL0386168.1 YhcN/YlaJ family sporulation lipoprotein [Tumebacillus amylolyticus]
MVTLQKIGTAVLALTLAVGFAGCGTNKAKNNAHVNSLDQPGALHTQRANIQSAGVQVRQDISNKLNSTSGLRNATVLVHDGNAYVGVINVGKEHTPDAAIKSGDNWNDMPYGTANNPKSAAGMNVDQMLTEGMDPAHTHDGPYSTITGNLDDSTKKQIEDIVRANVKGVKNVYITGNVDQVQKLSGYKHYISRGGKMDSHLQDFNQFIQASFNSGNNVPQQMQQQQLQNNARILPSPIR